MKSEFRVPRSVSGRVTSVWAWVSFFFFQAEDGIRDLTVTGVQTCALPILSSFRTDRDRAIAGLMLLSGLRSAEVLGLRVADVDIGRGWVRVTGKGDKRSEERRVGKECRSRWSPYH